jgi:TolB-like protein
MASLIPEYEYDIFISYRQKDNKGERWVSEFVSALETELESTFKEDITVYFDINPHDGLLETYDVDDSLKRKLKCLVFIPIVSRTYCDPKSYAWENEFKAFVEQASGDQFGLKLSLPNGNVVSRVLPVRIHDLDTTDMKLCESVLGSMLRGVDFVYKSTGVNRPLRPVEEHPHDNLNKTYYRDQINKVANSIRDIIQVLVYSGEPVKEERPRKEKVRVLINTKKLNSNKMVPWILLTLFVLICVSGIYAYTRAYKKNINQKTIAIIPFTNPLDDTDLHSAAVGTMDGIINRLQKIKSLSVRGYLTSYYYLNTKLSMVELRKSLKVNYLVIINMTNSGNDVDMRVSLSEIRNDNELWSENYKWSQKQIKTLFPNIVQTIAGKLDITLTREEILNMEKDFSEDPEAYGYYLHASAGLISAMGNKFPDESGFRSAISSYDKAIKRDSVFANAYARRAIALSWGYRNKELDSTSIEKCLSDINTAAAINKDLPDIYIARGFYSYYCVENHSNALFNFDIASEKDPESYLPRFYMAMVNKAMGNWKQVQSLLNTVIPDDPQDPLVLTNIGLCFQYRHIYDSALLYHQKAINVNRDWKAAYLNKYGTLILMGKIPDARNLLDSLSRNSDEKYIEDQINLDIYAEKYPDALMKATIAGDSDFQFKGIRSVYLAKICNLMHNNKESDNYYDSALVELNLALKADTGNAYIYGFIGVALAGRGNPDALTKGEKAVWIAKEKNDKILEIEMILVQAEILTKLGLFDDASEKIKETLSTPSLFSIELLKIDPEWKPLLKNPKITALLHNEK